jgi:predicted RNA-binding Zn-ribbon protein involved in translation (DUF1610 family)
VTAVDIGRRAWGYPCGSCGRTDWVYLEETVVFVLSLLCPSCGSEWLVDTSRRQVQVQPGEVA